ncbi:SAM-dependent methyltransferase [uncultured Campylobacter sp.]|uniref:SAM-dependent methyltransferase n=1 Tax=uncultured Campylobacter sp. TaxID=218934 RepID=UPI0028E228C7|nr:SAM-dependent methyltransferase [uncultured Campylobacter sp.]
MKFSDFFEGWLNESYYANAAKIGKSGDFYTAVSVGSFFGICIAREILRLSADFCAKQELSLDVAASSGASQQNLAANPDKLNLDVALAEKPQNSAKIAIVEIGSHDGRLLCDIAQAIFTLGGAALDKFSFAIIEPHERLRELQRASFAESFGGEIVPKHFTSAREAKFKDAIFVANELFDAFKCEAVDGENMLFIKSGAAKFAPIKERGILTLARRFGISSGEIPIGYFRFAREICASAQRFYFIAFDYGQMGSSGDFSLRIYRNHEVFSFFEVQNLSDFYGKSDLTYDVNFEILRAAFEDAGAATADFKRQIAALIDFGAVQLLELFMQKSGEKGYLNALLQFNHLRAEFGEKFKMIKFKKGL